METWYWGLFIAGVLFALVTLIFGEILGHLFGFLDSAGGHHMPVLQPAVLVGGITTFGGAGILLTRYTEFSPLQTGTASLLIAAALSMLTYLVYVKPMANSENSVGFSIQDLVGKIGEVNVPVPATGHGEVILRIGGGVTNQIAASFDGKTIASHLRVVVVDVKDGILLVSPLDSESEFN
ncbi:protease [Paenibacillus lutrae]|uniref:Protease n=1 Tax=Paenibacillus lutrae TaxID=2078573 RepID=A0A7X3K056_9BACL|nr:protease [Paenibacillus lutrae]MVP00879.1 protease [Paenibacillus lutrae]